ncbi:leaf rust 10 disease-resistance locus receptor-like protein kinase-like 1.1 [Quercus suber]|uniref:Leaf rust 10 disease-resistance locus receptor-like protein kinase-like 1.1 n=1 Tax=Quercus suber TaxID=58331 RepID=A0AAW0JUP9_QUESU
MASVSLFVVFVLSHLVPLHSAEEGKLENPYCRPFQCGNLGYISFPFTDIPHPPPPPFCGLMKVECDKTPPVIYLPQDDWGNERRYEVISISYYTNTSKYIRVKDHSLFNYLNTKECHYLDSFALPNSSFISFKLTTPTQTLFKCKSDLQLPVQEHSDNPELKITAEFDLEVHVSDACNSCGKVRTKLLPFSALAVGCAVFFMSTLFFIIWHLYKKKYPSSKLLARNTYSDPSSRSEVEGWSVYFGVPVFSYNELEKATNNFHVEKELGNGGFGTVYHGKLHDGREVAVKRLYRPNYRRVEQFINEIEKCAFHELIDPHLGFESDEGVRTMTILVAKLAFQCLQQDKEMRPSMDEVLEALKKIQSGKDGHEDQVMAYDDAGILNVQQPASPGHDEDHSQKIMICFVRASVNFPLLDGHELLLVYEYIPNGAVQQGQYKKIELTSLINT